MANRNFANGSYPGIDGEGNRRGASQGNAGDMKAQNSFAQSMHRGKAQAMEGIHSFVAQCAGLVMLLSLSTLNSSVVWRRTGLFLQCVMKRPCIYGVMDLRGVRSAQSIWL